MSLSTNEDSPDSDNDDDGAGVALACNISDPMETVAAAFDEDYDMLKETGDATQYVPSTIASDFYLVHRASCPM